MSHLMADGIRACGKPDGHKGKHYSQVTVQREIDRCRARRENPGPCTAKGCTRDRYQYDTGSYDVRCYPHADRHVSTKRLHRLEKESARLLGRPYVLGERAERLRTALAIFRVFAVTPTS
jgi:hypothetical protein